MITVLFTLLFLLIRLFTWALVLMCVFSMLASVGVLDTRNRIVFSIGQLLYRITDPVLRPIRNRLPQFSAIDISPMIVILLLQFVAVPLLSRIYMAIATDSWQGLIF